MAPALEELEFPSATELLLTQRNGTSLSSLAFFDKNGNPFLMDCSHSSSDKRTLKRWFFIDKRVG
ncbi:unnamed protein product [Sphenostylis stenocarpa]|uniref:Uncharacterized protein n=1 Tax=Sphenostylis stenocarpa TaxID=92480 RepID=A0AA86VH30_9FABA|nr:unnamed protein product [Sphenostylis stenocarpa]